VQPCPVHLNQKLEPLAGVSVATLCHLYIQPVDYWDYIGWKDIYARPSFTNRQRHLARLNQQKSIYTPEFFVNGSEARGTQSVVNKTQLSNKVLSTVDMELTSQQQKNNIVINLSSKFDGTLVS